MNDTDLAITCLNMMIRICEFYPNRWVYIVFLEFPADLVKFIDKILKGKFYVFYNVKWKKYTVCSYSVVC